MSTRPYQTHTYTFKHTWFLFQFPRLPWMQSTDRSTYETINPRQEKFPTPHWQVLLTDISLEISVLESQNRSSVPAHCTSCQSILVQPRPHPKNPNTGLPVKPTHQLANQPSRLATTDPPHTQQLVLACLFTPTALGTNTAYRAWHTHRGHVRSGRMNLERWDAFASPAFRKRYLSIIAVRNVARNVSRFSSRTISVAF